jgi:large subunit ribosomal protein L23
MSSIVLKPRMSEKSYAMSNDRVYVFDIDKSVNKHEVAKAVEETYEVTVINVRTTIVKGKAKRLYRNRRYETGKRSDVKKAYVTLKVGDAIPIFTAIEEAEVKAEKTSKTLEKVAEKQAKKEEKEAKKANKKTAKVKE